MNASRNYLSRLSAPTLVGLSLRLIFLVVTMFAVFALALTVQNWAAIDVEAKWLWASFLVILFSMVLGLVTSEYPAGGEFILLRLCVATFCRTGFPLLVILLAARYSGASFGTPVIGFLAAFYLVGFPTSIWLSLLRANSHGDQKSIEVDRATV